MKIFALCASLRRGSLNRKLLEAAAQITENSGATVRRATLGDFPMPLFDGDIQDSEGIPAQAQALAQAIEEADAVLLATPEYNFSIPGVLKNAIDWVSRMRPHPLATGKPMLLMATSPSGVGGIRGLWQTRIPLEGIGAYVHPGMFSLPHGKDAVGDGRLAEDSQQARLEGMIEDFMAAARALNARHG